MIDINKLDVGPIIGETSPNHVRLWGRASTPTNGGGKVHGVARLLVDENEVDVVFFKMTQLWDYTGVGVVEGLQPNTNYNYQIGWFESDLDTSELRKSPPGLIWDDIELNSVKTGSDNNTDTRSYLVGSCRYNFPWTGDDKDTSDTRGDKTFKAMLSHIEKNKTHGLLMLGDQVYADILGKGVDTQKGYFRLYKGAFKQENIRSLMSRLPTYMTLDDHEIEDNWPENRSDDDFYKLNAAKYAYQAYQVSHSPLLKFKNGRLDGIPDKFWYQHSDGCCEFFMMDVRTERAPKYHQMIDHEQMNGLKRFLLDSGDKVKVIGTGVPFFPDGGDDKWSGYSEQRNEIINFIRENKVRKVVFITGDVHFSSGAELRCKEDDDFKILSFTCSPLFWPFPHWAKLKYRNIRSNGYTYLISDKNFEYRKENYVRLTFSPDKVEFKIFPRKGRSAVHSKKYSW